MAAPARSPRFLTLTDVAEVLNTSTAQVMALVKRRDLRAMQIGGRGQWRVEASALEDYIAKAHAETQERLDATADLEAHDPL